MTFKSRLDIFTCMSFGGPHNLIFARKGEDSKKLGAL